MPVCIHCATPIESLYMRYGKDHIVLSPCSSSICSPTPACTSTCSTSPSDTATATGPAAGSASAAILADEYLEHDLPIVIIDLLLAKSQAYRHLLFNRSSIFNPTPDQAAKTTGQAPKKLKWGHVFAVLKRFVALCLVDAYIRWFYLCVHPSLPPAGGAELTKNRAANVMERMQRWVPMQAGMFFASVFTARSEHAEREMGAVGVVCSAAPLWLSNSASVRLAMSSDVMVPTLISYINVLMLTIIEASVLHFCVALLTHLTIRYLLSTQSSTSSKPTKSSAKPPLALDSHLADPLLPTQALLLSQLSPLILLLFVLLWNTKFPRPTTPTWSTSSDTSAFSKRRIVWIIRTFLASLNAGVALATCLPSTAAHKRKTCIHTLAPAAILAAAWSAQALISAWLYTCLE